MTPREPDRFEAKAREAFRAALHEGDSPSHEPVAAALRREREEALEQAQRAIATLRGPAINDAVARIDFLIDEVKLAPRGAALRARRARAVLCFRSGPRRTTTLRRPPER